MKTILEQFRELKRKRENLETGCATCGSNEDHNEVTDKGTFTHQFDIGMEVKMMDDENFITTIKEQMLIEIEKIRIERDPYNSRGDTEWLGIKYILDTLEQAIINKFGE